MAEKSGFFNSVNRDRVYDAADIAAFLSKFFTNGIFDNSLKVKSNNNMTVSVEAGSANINGYSYQLTEELILDIEDADSELSRIDSIILRLDLNNRQITAQVLKGSYATNPGQPAITRSENIYDLRLANILVQNATTRITDVVITDTRLSEDCGNVIQAVQSPNLSDVFAQCYLEVQNTIDKIKGILSDDVAGNLQNEIDTLQTNLDNAIFYEVVEEIEETETV